MRDDFQFWDGTLQMTVFVAPVVPQMKSARQRNDMYKSFRMNLQIYWGKWDGTNQNGQILGYE